MNPRRVKEGTWFYAGTAPARVLIEEVDFIPGSGDHEDSEEEREDKMGHFFRIDYTSAGSTKISSGGGYFASLEEAIHQAEKACAGIAWDHEEPIQPPEPMSGLAPGHGSP
jgi:hypothetical protein